jgi:hypothetical protein
VSAHVVPKVQAFAQAPEDEDDKTTIEAGWEEEASTTIEQGDVAEKLRGLGLGTEPKRANTSITSTSSVSDDPTVDDPRASAAVAHLPPTAVGRLVITAGTDAGQLLEVRPGKTYTVGRGIDNDLVLSDIAVSRKHFDLRHEHGAWVLADRGSGNGTLINTRIEDAPFMLATGDVIEIGNTSFRFELPEGAPQRRQPAFTPMETQSIDDDLEMSTVSGKPYRERDTPPESLPPASLPAPPLPAPAPPLHLSAPAARPKTLPPPAPLPRPRTQTGRPAMSFERGPLSAQMSAQLSAQMTVPAAPAHPPIALGLSPALAPLPGPHTLHMPQPSTTMPLPQIANRPPLGPAMLDPAAPPMPGTLPGQGALPPIRPARLPFSTYSAEIPTQRGPSSTRPPMIVAAGPLAARDATSTALVQPIAYGTGQPQLAVQPVYAPPPAMTRRMKLVIGGAAVTVLAAVATIAIIQGTGSSAPPPDTAAATKAAPAPKPAAPAVAQKPAANARPIVTPIPTPPAPRVAPVARTTERVAVVPPTTPVPATTAPVTTPPATTAPTTTAPTTRIEPAELRPRADRKPADKKPEKKPTERKPEPARVVETRPVEAPAERPEVKAPEKKRSGRSVQDVKSDANALYRSKNFAGAAQLITSALSGFSGDDAQELRSMAAIYSQLGKAYNVGMAPGTKSTEAFQALRRASSYDRDVGSAYLGEIQEHLAAISTKAAVSYMASKDYENAFTAVRTSESLGSSGSSSNASVREKLAGIASDLLREAQSDLQTDPDGAKKKAHQVLGMVDAKSPLYVKAQKISSGN